MLPLCTFGKGGNPVGSVAAILVGVGVIVGVGYGAGVRVGAGV